MLRQQWQNRADILNKIKHKLSELANLGTNSLNKWTARTPANLVGLEIGADTLKLMKINSSKKPYQVEYFSVSQTPPGAIVKDEIKDHAAIGNAIRSMLKNPANAAATYAIALAIPRSIAIIKNIMVDSRLTVDEIESRAWIEANRHFPDLVGDIYLDFLVTENPQDNTQLELILVACRKDQIKPYLEVLHHAGLTAKLIDVNCYALDRALPLATEKDLTQQTVALLNLNMSLSTLIVSHQQQLIYSHDQSYDGQRLLSQIQAYQANQTSTGQAPIDDPAYVNILKENLMSHLRHTIHFFYSSRPNMAIQHIIVSGDCATIPGLPEFIQREIGIETLLADPLSHLELAPDINVEEFKRYAPAMMQCSGLALSKIDR